MIVPGGGPAEGRKVSLVAFDKDTGEKTWEGGEDQIAYSSPSLVVLGGVRQILSVNETTVTGHDPKIGRVLWNFPWPGSSNRNANNSQAVAVGNERVFVSKGYTGGSALFDVRRQGDGWSTEPVWANSKSMKTKFTNAVFYKQHVYGLCDGVLECIELDTGKRCWKQGRYGHGQVLGVGDLLIVQGEDGNVFLVAMTPEAHEELGQFPALDGKTWNNPALVGRLLLVRNAEEAACYELPLAEPEPSNN